MSRYHAISKRLNALDSKTAVQSAGKPMSHSAHLGFGWPRRKEGGVWFPRLFFDGQPRVASDAFSVGSNKEPAPPKVWGMDLGSGYSIPSTLIARIGHFGCNEAQVSANPRDVLKEYEGGADFPNDPRHIEKKAASLAIQARARPRKAEVLARESGSDNIHKSTPWLPVECPEIVPNRSGEPLTEDFLAERVDLDVTDESDPLAKCKLGSADSGTKTQPT